MDYVSPAVALAAKSTRTESEMRELARAKLKAEAAYHACARIDKTGKTEDELINLELDRMLLFRALSDASYALHKAGNAI